MKYVIRLSFLVIFLGWTAVAHAADWPQFRGPNRDGKSVETGLLKKWPEGGPKLIWFVGDLGEGYSSAVIARSRVYITGKLDKEGYVFCFDLDGQFQWKVSYGPEWSRSYPAARTTPTVNENRLYVFSGVGVVTCFGAQKGEKIWSRDVFTEFKGQFPRWGLSECLLVDGDKVICTPGGQKASVVALDKASGQVIWACTDLTQSSAYGNPISVRYRGSHIIVTMLSDSVVGIDAATGKLLWRENFDDYHIDRKRLVNANVPLYHNGGIHTTSGYNNGGAMVRLSEDPTRIKRIWIDKTLDTHHGGTVLVEGYIYGSNWKSNSRGDWACLDWNTGRVVYDQKWLGNKGSIIYADGMLYCYEENTGYVALVSATLDGFKPVSQFKISRGKGKYWANPSIADGRLYIRHGAFLMVYDIKE